MLWNRRPSLAGRRIALDRKWRHNVAHYGGRTKLVTLTPPGEDLCPFGDETRVVNGETVRLVEGIYREVWNRTAQARASRLFEAAQRAADRWVQRHGWKGELPRQIGNVRAEQKRGLWHFHFQLPYETEVERLWSRTVHRFLDQAWRNDKARYPDEKTRRDLLFQEYCGAGITRAFYGFGFVNGGNPAGKSADNAARYMARNAAGYMALNSAGPGRHYVSARITRATGITMKKLRACNWLHVRTQLIASGELDDSWLPSHWTEEWTSEVLRVWYRVAVRAP